MYCMLSVVYLLCGNSSKGKGEELGAPEPQNGGPSVLIPPFLHAFDSFLQTKTFDEELKM